MHQPSLFKSCIPYLLCVGFVALWWIAFLHFPNKKTIDLTIQNLSSVNSELAIVSRKDLHQALAGDIDLMIALASKWNYPLAQRMNDLSLQIENEKPSTSRGNSIRILPQTESAASFALALANPEQIVAISQNIRKQTQLYSSEITSKIPINVGSYSREALFLLHPTVALVANYSNPSLIRNLVDQGVEVKSLINIQSLSDFRPAVLEIGKILNQPKKAEILAIFIEAALESMEKHLQGLRLSNKLAGQRILYLNDRGKYCTPTKKILLGQMFASLGINQGLHTINPQHLHQWRIPLTQEQIVNYNPDCLIISTLTKEDSLKILNEPAFAKLAALQNGKLFFVDEIIQEAFSQYIVLAYYDLYRIILDIHS